MCFQVISMLSRRLKGKWSLRRRQGFHSTLSVLSTLRHHSTLSLHIGIIFHSYIICQKGETTYRKGLYFTHKYPFLAIHAKGGESISPKQKDRTTTTTTNFKILVLQFVLKKYFQIGINFKILVLQFVLKKYFSNWYIIVDIISNWYTLFKIIIKTLLNTKRRISLRGSFVQSNEEHLKQGEKISNLVNASQESYSFTFDYLRR
jgi:hypothetical protein